MGVYRVACQLTYPAPGGPGVNVWHIATGTTETFAAVDVRMDIVQAFYSSIRPLLNLTTAVVWDGVATEVDTGEQLQGDGFTVVGSGNALYAPLATSLVVGWRTGTAQRSGIGRTFIGPVVQSSVEANGTPTDTALTTLRTAAATLVAANDAAQTEEAFGLGVYSRKNGTLRPFQSARVRDSFAVLRSRRD